MEPRSGAFRTMVLSPESVRGCLSFLLISVRPRALPTIDKDSDTRPLSQSITTSLMTLIASNTVQIVYQIVHGKFIIANLYAETPHPACCPKSSRKGLAPTKSEKDLSQPTHADTTENITSYQDMLGSNVIRTLWHCERKLSHHFKILKLC